MKLRIYLVYNHDGVGAITDSVVLEGEHEDLVKQAALVVEQRKPDDHWSEEIK